MSAWTRQLPLLRVPEWEHIPGLVHAFCGRRGGCSVDEFAELNLSAAVGDDPKRVRQNWQRLECTVGAAVRFVEMRQHHGDTCVAVDGAGHDVPEADALVTGSPGLALCILTADCVPLLLVAPHYRAVAAVHAGWRGTVLGVTRRAVHALGQRFGVPPSAVHAALGPSIGACCYEVDREIAEAVERRWGVMPQAVTKVGRKSRLDLRLINRALLLGLGVPPEQIHSTGPCTRCAADDYFSHRAAYRRDAPGRTGRQASFVGWAN